MNQSESRIGCDGQGGAFHSVGPPEHPPRSKRMQEQRQPEHFRPNVMQFAQPLRIASGRGCVIPACGINLFKTIMARRPLLAGQDGTASLNWSCVLRHCLHGVRDGQDFYERSELLHLGVPWVMTTRFAHCQIDGTSMGTTIRLPSSNEIRYRSSEVDEFEWLTGDIRQVFIFRISEQCQFPSLALVQPIDVNIC